MHIVVYTKNVTLTCGSSISALRELHPRDISSRCHDILEAQPDHSIAPSCLMVDCEYVCIHGALGIKYVCIHGPLGISVPGLERWIVLYEVRSRLLMFVCCCCLL